jgi:hypothetical protein
VVVEWIFAKARGGRSGWVGLGRGVGIAPAPFSQAARRTRPLLAGNAVTSLATVWRDTSLGPHSGSAAMWAGGASRRLIDLCQTLSKAFPQVTVCLPDSQATPDDGESSTRTQAAAAQSSSGSTNLSPVKAAAVVSGNRASDAGCSLAAPLAEGTRRRAA